jgi:hypothetical protein
MLIGCYSHPLRSPSPVLQEVTQLRKDLDLEARSYTEYR